jgi:DNA-binding MarR family transcriptional regulator
LAQHSHYETTHTAELVDVLRGFMRLKRHLKPVAADEFAQAREHFHKLLPHDETWNRHDLDLFYQVGGVLSHREESMTMGELSLALDVPLSTTTRIIDHLVKSEYAVRLPDPDDRRIVRISLSETGRQLFKGLDEFMLARVDQVLKHLTPNEQETLVGLLRKLLGALTDEMS